MQTIYKTQLDRQAYPETPYTLNNRSINTRKHANAERIREATG